MSEHFSRGEAIKTEQYRQIADEITLQVIAKGGNIREVTTALNAVGLNDDAAVRVIHSLQDRQVIILDSEYKLHLTGAGEAYILEKGTASEDVTELADIQIRMKQLGQRLLKSTEESY
jgi:hypothetical protein